MAIWLQLQPTIANMQAKRQHHGHSIAEPASHPDFQLVSKLRATIGYVSHHYASHRSLSINRPKNSCIVEHITMSHVFTGFPSKFVVGLTSENTHLPHALPCHFYMLGMLVVLEHSPVLCNQHTPAGFLESLLVFILHLHPSSLVNMVIGNNFVYHNQTRHGHSVLKEHQYNAESNMLILTVRGFFCKHILHGWHSDTTFYLCIHLGCFRPLLDNLPKSCGRIWQAQPKAELCCSPNYKAWREYQATQV
jgi:hypothetical protein